MLGRSNEILKDIELVNDENIAICKEDGIKDDVKKDLENDNLIKSDVEMFNYIIEKTSEYEHLKDKSDEFKEAVFKSLKLSLEFNRRRIYKEDRKEDIIEELKTLYYSTNIEEILCTTSVLQSILGQEDNIIKEEISKYENSSEVYRVYGNIERNRYKNHIEGALDDGFLNSIDSCIDKYCRVVEIESCNYKALHSLGEAYMMKAENSEVEYLDMAIECFNKSLKTVKSELKEAEKEEFISLELIAESYKRKCEASRNCTYEEWEANAKKLQEYLYILDNFKSNGNVKIKYYNRHREKACMELLVGYMKFNCKEMAKMFADEIISMYYINPNLFKKRNLNIIIRSFCTKSRVLYSEGKIEDAKKSLEMALSLKYSGIEINSCTYKLICTCMKLLGYEEKLEEGAITRINKRFSEEFKLIDEEDNNIENKSENNEDKEEIVQDKEFTFIEKNCMGRLMCYNPKREIGSIYNKKDNLLIFFRLKDIESNLDALKLRDELRAYEITKFFVKYDLYKDVRRENLEKSYLVAKNIKLEF